MRRKRNILIVAAAVTALALAGCGSRNGGEDPPTPAETTLTHVGQAAPDFTLLDLQGGEFTLSDKRGQVVLINWFATWCPPCQEEMPELRDKVWHKNAGEDFVMVSIAREETPEVVAPFREKYVAGWRFLVDPERKAYSQYAEAYIPRNHVIGRDGKILFQSDGYEPEDFQALVDAVDAALNAP